MVTPAERVGGEDHSPIFRAAASLDLVEVVAENRKETLLTHTRTDVEETAVRFLLVALEFATMARSARTEEELSTPDATHSSLASLIVGDGAARRAAALLPAALTTPPRAPQDFVFPPEACANTGPQAFYSSHGGVALNPSGFDFRVRRRAPQQAAPAGGSSAPGGAAERTSSGAAAPPVARVASWQPQQQAAAGGGAAAAVGLLPTAQVVANIATALAATTLDDRPPRGAGVLPGTTFAGQIGGADASSSGGGAAEEEASGQEEPEGEAASARSLRW